MSKLYFAAAKLADSLKQIEKTPSIDSDQIDELKKWSKQLLLEMAEQDDDIKIIAERWIDEKTK